MSTLARLKALRTELDSIIRDAEAPEAPQPTPKPEPSGDFRPVKEGVVMGPDKLHKFGGLPVYARLSNVERGTALEMLYLGCNTGPTAYEPYYGLSFDKGQTWAKRSPIRGEMGFGVGPAKGGGVVTVVQRGENGRRRLEIHVADDLTSGMEFRHVADLCGWSKYVSDFHCVPGYNPESGRYAFDIRLLNGKGVWPRSFVRVTTNADFGDVSVNLCDPVDPTLEPDVADGKSDFYAVHDLGGGVAVLSVHAPANEPGVNPNSAAGVPLEECEGADNTIHAEARQVNGKWTRDHKALIANGTPGPRERHPAPDAGMILVLASYRDTDGSVVLLCGTRPYPHIGGTHPNKYWNVMQVRLR